MTTPSAWLLLLAAVLFVVGFALSVRQPGVRTKIVGIVATMLATFVTGWIAWYVGIQV